MITHKMIYLLTRLDSIKGFLETGFSFTLLLIISVALMALGLILYLIYRSVAVESSEKKRTDYMFLANVSKKTCKYSIILMIFCYAIPIFMKGVNALTPTSKEAAVIYVVPKVLNSEFVQKDIPAEARELYKMSKEWLMGYIKNGEAKRDKEVLLKVIDGIPMDKVKSLITKHKAEKQANKARIEAAKARLARKIKLTKNNH